MKKASSSDKNASASAASGKKSGSSLNTVSLATALAKREEEVVGKPLHEIRRRLWLALPSVAQVVAETAAAATGDDSANGAEDERATPASAVDAMSVPWSEMRDAVHCLYLATHSNPTAEDTQSALVSLVGTAEEPTQLMYTQADLFSFLDTVPALWLPHYELIKTVSLPSSAAAATVSPSVERAIKLLNNELIDCVTMDEAPGSLLKPEEVLMLSNHHATNPLLPKAAPLRTPVGAFFSFVEHRRYPVVFDRLWATLGGAAGGTLSWEQFATFVTWFSALHFTNATETRSRAAALPLFYEFLNVKGAMCIRSFQRACVAVCARYAQRRDAAQYLSQLLACFSAAAGAADGALTLSLASVDLAAVEARFPRRTMRDPEDLYVSDELRVWQAEQSFLSEGPSTNRIVVYGDRAVGKSTVGTALAAHLRCTHLDVLELCAKAVLTATSAAPPPPQEEESSAKDRDADAGVAPDMQAPAEAPGLDAEVLRCVEKGEAIPLSLQAALLRRELAEPSTSNFKGFVFSDTIAPLPNGDFSPQDYEAFLRDAGFVDVAVPTIFLELKQPNAQLRRERARAAQEAQNAAYAAVRARESEETERLRRETEEQEMRASCEAIIHHFKALQSGSESPDANNGEGATAAELAVAEQQAAEAADILAQLDAEKAESEEVAAARPEEEEAESEDREARERSHLEIVLRHLLEQGRQELFLAEHSTEEDCTPQRGDRPQAESLAAAVPVWAPCITAAHVLNRLLSADASSPVEEVVSYVTETLRLHPCVLPFIPIGPQDPDTTATTADSTGGGDDVTATAYAEALRAGEEEECGRLLEAAAAERGYTVSPEYKRFCPVTYEEDGVLVEGAACFQCVYRGHQYYATSRAKLARFMANPPAYLGPKQSVSDKQRVLLVAGDSLKHHLGGGTAALAGSRLVANLADALQLTPLSLAEYASGVGRYCELRNRRRDVLAARREYEARELQQRDERLEKRAKLDAKKKKTGNATKSTAKNAPDGAAIVSIVEPRHPAKEAEGSPGGTRPLFVPTPTEAGLQRRIEEARAKEKDAVPMLVSMAAWDEASRADAQMLLDERCMPECVVVLESSGASATGSPHEGTTEEEDDGETQGDDTQGRASSSCVKALLESLAKAEAAAPRAGGVATWKRKEGDNALPPQRFTTHVVPWEEEEDKEEGDASTSPSTRTATCRRILQAVCPAAPRVEEGTVDEELGVYDEDDEEEQESEMNDDDEAEMDGGGDGADGDARKALALGALPPVAKTDPKLKPRRQFLHQFGSRLEYCPVALRDKRLLLRGRHDLALSFRGKLYCFADEECKRDFAADPLRYAAPLPPRDVPPRLWVIGADLSGKRTLAAGLAREFGVHSFVYDRGFFEACIEAAQKPGGSTVGGVVVPQHPEGHMHVVKAAALLKEVREFAAEQEKHLKLRAAAEAVMEERERKEAERAEREANGELSDGAEDEEEDDTVDEEEEEALLQEQLQYEPEDPADAQERLTEAYLRMAACVTRFEPFESQGYVMVTPPFSEADLDILFTENCIPEAVVHLQLRTDVYEERRDAAERERSAARLTRITAARELAATTAPPAGAEGGEQPAALAETRRREKALLRWRRRNIGAEDAAELALSDDDDKGGGGAQGEEEVGEEEGEGLTGGDPDANGSDPLEAVAEFAEAIADRRVPVYRPNANVAKAALLRATTTALARHLANRVSFFSAVEVVEYKKATAMLREGQASLSSFGYVDPVELREHRDGKRRPCTWKVTDGDDDATVAFAPEPLLPETGGEERSRQGNPDDSAENAPEGEGEEEEEMSEMDPDELEEMKERVKRRRKQDERKRAPRCGLLGNRLYFFANDDTLARFVANPLPFTEAPPPLPPPSVRLPVVAMFTDDAFWAAPQGGNPPPSRTGGVEASLGEAVASALGAVLVSEASLLAWAAQRPCVLGSLAAKALTAALASCVDDEFIAELLVARLGSAEVKRKGALLLNLPKTARQVRAIASAAPHCPQISATVRVEGSPATHAATTTTTTDTAASALRSPMIAWADTIQQQIAASLQLVPHISVPFPSSPRDPANLAELVRSIDAAADTEKSLLWRRQRAFPTDLRGTRQLATDFEARLSPYKWFCPYAWVERDELVKVDRDRLDFCAEFLGECYVFSEADFLARFLVNPHEVADPSTLRALPATLPVPVPPAEAATVGKLSLKGCCPVLLYDTRERLGLRGVVEPVAKPGSRDCLVAYDGELYACLDEAHKQRFLRQPWRYVGGAALPAARKCPLTDNAVVEEERTAGRQVSDEEFVRRQLYDAVARAMVAVADARPRYPGLSDEESALKFMSLYMKAHRETNGEVQQAQYDRNFALFEKRATLYKGMGAAAAAHAKAADFEVLCDEYEMMQNGAEDVSQLGHLARV